MALRAGYYGIKRGLKAKLAEIAGKWNNVIDIINVFEITNVFNVMKHTGSSSEVSGITYVVNDDYTITATTGTASANASKSILSAEALNALLAKYGDLWLSGCPADGSSTKYNLLTRYTDSSSVAHDVLDTGNGVQLYASITYDRPLYVRVMNGQSVNNLVFKPMLSKIPGEYQPPASSNLELTDSAADQKTTINAIITAATGAADFAAFKTAMGAITPVTRSLSKEASPEDVLEAIEEEKPVTRKTTKKTTVKEGE